jgi:release factor glutamine methyltransferase
LEEVHNGRQSTTIIDLGTGCGNIAISLSKNIPQSQIYALDISREALKVAQENAQGHNLNGKIIFLEGDLFSPFRKLKKKVDIIVSNPPYIAGDDFEKLPPEVNFEPRLALEGGEEGLDFYKRIIPQAPHYLKRGGVLALEIGINQASQVRNLIRARKEFSVPKILKDYRGIKRIILARKSN